MMGVMGEMYNVSGGPEWGCFYMLNMDTHGGTHTWTHIHIYIHTGLWQDAHKLSATPFTVGHTEAQGGATTYSRLNSRAMAKTQSPGVLGLDSLRDARPQGLDRS